MLPGFRFLFAAIVLSMSVLVFGLGAAALLRAAHEQFASTPAWRAAPEPKFAHWNHLPRDASRQTSSETPGGPPRETTREIAEEEGLREHETPVLGMLRVEPEPVPPQAAESIPESTIEAEPAVVTAAPDEPEQTAALEPRDSPPPEAAMPAMPIPELSVQSVATAAPAAAEETRMTATEQAVQPAHEAVAPAVEPTVAPSAAPAEIVAAKVATLRRRRRRRSSRNPTATCSRSGCRRGAPRSDAASHCARDRLRLNRLQLNRPRLNNRPPIPLLSRRLQPAAAEFGRQAGPIAIGGPSGSPHSAHEPS